MPPLILPVHRPGFALLIYPRAKPWCSAGSSVPDEEMSRGPQGLWGW